MVYIPELDRQGFADRQSIKNRRPRPAINFTQRDDVRDFARSGPGRNYFAIENLQAQAPSFAPDDPRIDELKKRRRTWNRYQKYPAGEMLGKTPQQMQKGYRGLSRDLRQTAKPVYNRMYPITGKFMDVAEKGGIWGAMLSNFLGGKGKEIKKSIESVGDRIGGGISNFIDDDKEKEEYAAKTFPFYPSDVHPGPTYYDGPEDLEDFEDAPDAPIKRIEEEVYVGPRPHEKMPYLSDEAAAIQKEFNTNPYFQNLQDPNVVLPFEKERRGHPHLETYTPDAGPRLGTADPHEPEDITVAPWLTDPSIPMPEELVEGEYVPGQFYDELIEEEAPPPIASFNDSGREAGIAALYGQGPRWASTNRRYEKEYRDYIMSSGDQIDYDDFERMYEEIYQGKPHALHSSYR